MRDPIPIPDLKKVHPPRRFHAAKTRRIAVQLYLSGMSYRKVAWLFDVVPSTVYLWRNLYWRGYLDD